MRFRSLVTAMGVMGAIACVPIVRSAIAQITPTEASTQSANTSPDEEIDCDDYYDTNVLYEDLEKLKLSEDQREAYHIFSGESDVRGEEVLSRAHMAEDPNGPLGFRYKEEFYDSLTVPKGGPVPDFDAAIAEHVPPEIMATIDEILESEPMLDQKDTLNEEFGQYGEFYSATLYTLTSEQEEQLDQIDREFYDQVTAIMTPEQLPQYLESLEAQLQADEACNWGPWSTL